MKKIRKITISLISVSIIIILSGCGQNDELKEGKYSLENSNGQSYIALSDFSKDNSDYLGTCYLQFENVDLTTFEETSINNTFSNYVFENNLNNLSEKEQADLRNEFLSKIDLKKQFVDNKSLFEYGYSEEQEGYWLMSEINGSGFNNEYETYVSMQYIPEENTLIFDEKKYVLEE